MVFSGLFFLFYFLPVVFLFYFLIRSTTYRNWVLIAASFVFYAWGEPVWVSLLLLSGLVAYGSSLLINRYRGVWIGKAVLISTIVLNLAVLGYFKYLGFLFGNLNLITGWSLHHHELALPIGISFFTFQSISFVVDVYRGDLKAQSLTKVLLYLSLFPQLVAGPIVRYTDIEHEMDNRTFSLNQFSQGVNRFIIGLGKKVIFANALGQTASSMLDGNLSELSVLGAWFAISLFALQIYFDFSGYSDMAIGLGKMFGFTYQENFNYPYVSRSASDFWRRWNMSLGSFFRDYVYIPLGGNRRYYIRNLFIVWFLTGFWHGANWNFIIWGLYFGVLIFLERVLYGKWLQGAPRFISHVYMTAAMLVGWVFFYFIDLNRGLEFVGILFGLGDHPFYSVDMGILFENNVIIYVLAIIASTPLWKSISGWMSRQDPVGRLYQEWAVPIGNAVLLLLATLMLVGATYNPFLYFRF